MAVHRSSAHSRLPDQDKEMVRTPTDRLIPVPEKGDLPDEWLSLKEQAGPDKHNRKATGLAQMADEKSDALSVNW